MIWSLFASKPVADTLPIPSRASLRARPLMGARVHLNAIDPADGPAIWRSVEASRPELSLWLPWVPYNTSITSSQRYAESCAEDWDMGRSLRFGIRANHNAQLLGIVSLDNCVHLHRNCDLGYWLETAAVGHGLMTEAATLCLGFAFGTLKMRRVRCAVAKDNARSLAVVKRLGFHLEGLARQAEFVGGRWVDHAVFSRLDTDPEP
jgi:ribosomal-protein-serine acetyltransferase